MKIKSITAKDVVLTFIAIMTVAGIIIGSVYGEWAESGDPANWASLWACISLVIIAIVVTMLFIVLGYWLISCEDCELFKINQND